MNKIYHGKHFTIRITGVTMQKVAPDVRARIEAARKELDSVIFGICDRLDAEKRAKMKTTENNGK